MRTKITLFLLLLNVVLFFFIFGVERKWHTERLIEESRSRVLGPEAANIQSLQISGSSLPDTVQLERNGESWHIMAPYEWPANPHAGSRIINEPQFLQHETSFAADNRRATDLSRADYGLDNPNLTVTFRSGSGETALETSLAIGDKTKIGQRLYVLSPDGSRVHVVSDSLANSLSIDLEQLRTNACFTIPVFEIRSLNLQNDGPANVRVRLRRENNRWRFESPVVTRASKAQTEVAVSDIATLRTAEFLGECLSAFQFLQFRLPGHPYSPVCVVLFAVPRQTAEMKHTSGMPGYAILLSGRGGRILTGRKYHGD